MAQKKMLLNDFKEKSIYRLLWSSEQAVLRADLVRCRAVAGCRGNPQAGIELAGGRRLLTPTPSTVKKNLFSKTRVLLKKRNVGQPADVVKQQFRQLILRWHQGRSPRKYGAHSRPTLIYSHGLRSYGTVVLAWSI